MASKTKKYGYQSDIDEFFHEFDSKRKSVPIATQAEIDKHEPIFEKRDKPIEEKPSELWEGF